MKLTRPSRDFILLVLVLYGLIWLGGYVALMGFDFSLISEYFVYGWTGGGEIPGAINLVAIAGAVVMSSLILGVRAKRALRVEKDGLSD